MAALLFADSVVAFEADYDSFRSVWYDRYEPWRANNNTPMPRFKGAGYIAGEAPDGLVLSVGLPAARVVDLFHRDTGILVMSTVSNGTDGTYLFSGLDESALFDVRFRGLDDAEGDIFAPWITPEPP